MSAILLELERFAQNPSHALLGLDVQYPPEKTVHPAIFTTL